MRPDPPFYVGTTRPSRVGWTRIGVTVVSGAIVTVLLADRVGSFASPLVLLLVAAMVLLTLWTWMHHWTRFIVDEHGVTVSLGGFLPRAAWPLADFRTVQLRELPASTLGASLGGYGWRKGRALSSTPEELRPVGRRKIYTTGMTRQPYRLLVTRAGTMVEIIGRGDTNYLLTPVDPEATAAAVDQAIRARR